MTDVTITAANTPTPVVVEGDSSFDAELDAFFNHRLDDSFEAPQDPAPAAAAETPAPETPAAETPAPGAPAPEANAEPAAASSEGGESEVDPDLIASIMLGTPVAPAPTPAPEPAAPAAGPSEEERFMPLQAKRGMIPAPVLDAIFNSEDPIQREEALMSLMTSWGNAILQLSDERVRNHHYPRMQESFAMTSRQMQEARATHEDFYKDYPDLKAAPQLVARVAEAVQKKNPEAKYGPEMKKLIGSTARELAKKMGLSVATPAKSAATPAPFVAGGARPQGTGNPQKFDPTDPATLVDELFPGF